MNAIREIAEKADVADVIERYGSVKIIRGGKFSCPFHGEDRHPSAEVRKTNRWCCYACGAGGDAVNFVSLLYHLSMSDAAQMISDDFGLGISVRAATPEERKKRREEWEKWKKEKQKKEEENERIKQEWLRLVRLYRTCKDAIRAWTPETPDDLDYAPPLWAEAVKKIDYIEYLLEEFPPFHF